jgi:methionine-rich copper-binding protein CopC
MDAISQKAWPRGAARVGGLLAAIALVLFHSTTWAHAFVSRSEPRGGTTLGEPPAQISIWFDGPIESLFAMIRVENGDKRRVDKGDGRVHPGDNRLLEVGSRPTVPGEPVPAPSRPGPDLTEVGRRHPGYLVESIMNPNAMIVDGPGYTDSRGLSIMSDYRNELTVGELIDLVAYLKSR